MEITGFIKETIKRALYDETPMYFSVTSMVFAFDMMLVWNITIVFFGLWVEYENVGWPVLNPIFMIAWSIGYYLNLALLLFGGLTFILCYIERKS